MKTNQNSLVALATLAVASLYSTGAFAQSVGLGQLVTNFRTSNLGPLADFAGSIAFFAGIVIAILGVLKFRAHTANPNDPSAKMGTAVTYIVVGVALVAIPTVLNVGVVTVFGSGAKTTGIDTTLRTLGG